MVHPTAVSACDVSLSIGLVLAVASALHGEGEGRSSGVEGRGGLRDCPRGLLHRLHHLMRLQVEGGDVWLQLAEVHGEEVSQHRRAPSVVCGVVAVELLLC